MSVFLPDNPKGGGGFKDQSMFVV